MQFEKCFVHYDDDDNEYITFTTNNGDTFTRIMSSDQWKIIDYNTEYKSSGNVTSWFFDKKESKVDDSENLEKLYNEFLGHLADKYPDDKNPIYYHSS